MAGAKAETGPALAGLRLLGIVAGLTPAPAAAGAWLAPAGGQHIISVAAGENQNEPVLEASAFWEAPQGNDFAFVAAPWVEFGQDGEDNPWRAEATFAVKHVFYRDGPNVAAVQAGPLWVSQPDEGCSEGGAELRFLGGRSASENVFFNAEIAGRGLVGGCEGGRIELTAGYRPAANWLAMGQVFFDSPVDGEETTKVQFTLVRFNETGHGLQIGLRARIDGEAAEPALVLGLWGRPGD